MKHFIILITLVVSISCFSETHKRKDLTGFFPVNYNIVDTIIGDLNKDGIEDYVLVIKNTDKSAILNHAFKGTLDTNRRGIVVLFDKGTHYEIASSNYNCFSSDNESGDDYTPPDLVIEIKNNELYISYAYGKYGYWKYTFRYQNGDFELIGYDASYNLGAVVMREVSVNFSTKKKLIRVNSNESAEPGKEVFKDTWSKISNSKLLRLSKIDDFSKLEF